jgi:SOS response regulatory protein OraA/RecX
LWQKGIESSIVEAAVADLDEASQALEAARPRALRLADLPPEEFRKKLGDFLLRRGFAYDVVRDTVRQLWREATGERLEIEDDGEM